MKAHLNAINAIADSRFNPEQAARDHAASLASDVIRRRLGMKAGSGRA